MKSAGTDFYLKIFLFSETHDCNLTRLHDIPEKTNMKPEKLLGYRCFSLPNGGIFSFQEGFLCRGLHSAFILGCFASSAWTGCHGFKI